MKLVVVLQNRKWTIHKRTKYPVDRLVSSWNHSNFKISCLKSDSAELKLRQPLNQGCRTGMQECILRLHSNQSRPRLWSKTWLIRHKQTSSVERKYTDISTLYTYFLLFKSWKKYDCELDEFDAKKLQTTTNLNTACFLI